MKEQRYRLSTLLLVIGLLLPFGTLADSQNTKARHLLLVAIKYLPMNVSLGWQENILCWLRHAGKL